MKATAKKILFFVMSVLTVLALLCSCGSELDGTWTSNADKSTKIKFSGSKVKVSRGNFKLSGTYELDEEDQDLITMNLTDENGNIYRIVAKKRFGKKGAKDDSEEANKYREEDKNILVLENTANGEKETFVK